MDAQLGPPELRSHFSEHALTDQTLALLQDTNWCAAQHMTAQHAVYHRHLLWAAPCRNSRNSTLRQQSPISRGCVPRCAVLCCCKEEYAAGSTACAGRAVLEASSMLATRHACMRHICTLHAPMWVVLGAVTGPTITRSAGTSDTHPVIRVKGAATCVCSWLPVFCGCFRGRLQHVRMRCGSGCSGRVRCWLPASLHRRIETMCSAACLPAAVPATFARLKACGGTCLFALLDLCDTHPRSLVCRQHSRLLLFPPNCCHH